MTSIDMTGSEPHQRSSVLSDAPGVGMWRSLRNLWCRHRETITTPKTATMPAHLVCQTCGWREPVLATRPQGTRTWDSSRDEERYQREKKRREAIAEQRQTVEARLAIPTAPRASRRPRARRDNVLELKRAVGE